MRTAFKGTVSQTFPAYDLIHLLTLLLPGGHKVPTAQITGCSAVSSRVIELKLDDFSSNSIY